MMKFDTEIDIVWLENPNRWPYVREGVYLTTRRLAKPPHHPVGERSYLIGYARCAKRPGSGRRAYRRRIWFLKSHDLIGRYCRGEIVPTEAVVPASITLNGESDHVQRRVRDVS